jgi:hypothetical protein
VDVKVGVGVGLGRIQPVLLSAAISPAIATIKDVMAVSIPGRVVQKLFLVSAPGGFSPPGGFSTGGVGFSGLSILASPQVKTSDHRDYSIPHWPVLNKVNLE